MIFLNSLKKYANILLVQLKQVFYHLLKSKYAVVVSRFGSPTQPSITGCPIIGVGCSNGGCVDMSLSRFFCFYSPFIFLFLLINLTFFSLLTLGAPIGVAWGGICYE